MMSEDLIARLEAATEGSRELDDEIMRHLYPRHDLRSVHGSLIQFNEDPLLPKIERRRSDFTRSVDAAMTLAPEGAAADIHVGPGAIYNEATVWLPVKGEDAQGRRTASFTAVKTLRRNTPPLSLCIAALKARAAK